VFQDHKTLSNRPPGPWLQPSHFGGGGGEATLGFELGASRLLGRWSTTSATPPTQQPPHLEHSRGVVSVCLPLLPPHTQSHTPTLDSLGLTWVLGEGASSAQHSRSSLISHQHSGHKQPPWDTFCSTGPLHPTLTMWH
jgi:hypothetical protein